MIKKPLLSIAIPTFNRAAILDLCLSRLIPQLVPFADKIELIISDNFSTDNTQQVITKYKNKNLGIKLITHLQSENTGYFGNFKTCKELSNGEYFWLLSDNEHLNYDSVEILIELMENKSECGAFFLDSFDNKNCTNDKILIKAQFADDFFNSEYAYTTTLISSVIFRNKNLNDELLFKRFKGNLFLGFILFCSSLSESDLICSVRYSFFNSVPTNVTFDIFKAWAIDIIQCVDYMVENKLLDTNTKEVFMSGFISTNVFGHVVLFRKGKSIGFINYSLNELRVLLDDTYALNETYLKKVHPILFATYLGFYWILIQRKLQKILRRFSTK